MADPRVSVSVVMDPKGYERAMRVIRSQNRLTTQTVNQLTRAVENLGNAMNSLPTGGLPWGGGQFGGGGGGGAGGAGGARRPGGTFGPAGAPWNPQAGGGGGRQRGGLTRGGSLGPVGYDVMSLIIGRGATTDLNRALNLLRALGPAAAGAVGGFVALAAGVRGLNDQLTQLEEDSRNPKNVSRWMKEFTPDQQRMMAAIPPHLRPQGQPLSWLGRFAAWADRPGVLGLRDVPDLDQRFADQRSNIGRWSAFFGGLIGRTWGGPRTAAFTQEGLMSRGREFESQQQQFRFEKWWQQEQENGRIDRIREENADMWRRKQETEARRLRMTQNRRFAPDPQQDPDGYLAAFRGAFSQPGSPIVRAEREAEREAEKAERIRVRDIRRARQASTRELGALELGTGAEFKWRQQQTRRDNDKFREQSARRDQQRNDTLDRIAANTSNGGNDVNVREF